MKELSSWDWSEMTIFGMSWNFRVLDDFGLDGTWTCGTQFEWFSVSCHELCMSFHFCCMTCLWVLYAWEPLWPVLQFCEELCMHWQLDLDWVCGLPQVLYYFCFVWDIEVWSITYLPVKMCGTHLGVVVSVIFGRKCDSSVKVCVTHLRMNKREFVLGMAWNGWVVTCMVSRWIVKLNCRLCPSCIWAPAYPESASGLV